MALILIKETNILKVILKNKPKMFVLNAWVANLLAWLNKSITTSVWFSTGTHIEVSSLETNYDT